MPNTTNNVVSIKTARRSKVEPKNRKTGEVVRFNDKTGYGFVSCGDDQKDIFVHINDVRKAGIETLHVGDLLSFRAHYEEGKGLQVRDPELVKSSPRSTSERGRTSQKKPGKSRYRLFGRLLHKSDRSSEHSRNLSQQKGSIPPKANQLPKQKQSGVSRGLPPGHVLGYVDRYDVQSGIGFVTRDDGKPDLQFNHELLTRAGVSQGQILKHRVVVKVRQEKGQDVAVSMRLR